MKEMFSRLLLKNILKEGASRAAFIAEIPVCNQTGDFPILKNFKLNPLKTNIY